ncbi:MAG: right-handed parallel beta-helix repeat-containing protein [Candidatus Bathyarchaeia archaeon]|jgi:parallel beta-helix repeat protein
MGKKAILTACLFGLIMLSLCTINPEPTKAQSFSIIINADGSVTGTSNIQRTGNVYTFTRSISGAIVVQRDNVVINGDGYVLQPETDKLVGVDISGRNGVTIKNLIIQGFSGRCAILVTNANNCNIQDNTFRNNNIGIEMTLSSNCRIISNRFENNGEGLELYSVKPATDNVISDNKFINNTAGLMLKDFQSTQVLNNLFEKNKYGFSVGEAPGSKLRNNILNGNIYSFRIHNARTVDIDTSNTINNKPIINWVNQHDLTVPIDAGYVALIDCSNITVKNLNLTSNYDGVFLLSTTNSTITSNTFSNNLVGVNLDEAHNNIITENVLINNENGVSLQAQSSNNSIYENMIHGNKWGVFIDNAAENSITRNSIINSQRGVFTQTANSNVIHHNNFINNTEGWNDTALTPFTFKPISVNVWDDGCEGNYWSDYNGTDQNGDGIGDTPHVIGQNNTDRYPLTKPVSINLPLPESPVENSSKPTDPFPITTILITILITVALIIAGLLVYLKKRHRRGKP